MAKSTKQLSFPKDTLFAFHNKTLFTRKLHMPNTIMECESPTTIRLRTDANKPAKEEKVSFTIGMRQWEGAATFCLY
jgi:hypothetical protein